MRHGWIAFIIISIGLISAVYGSAEELFQSSLIDPHRLSKKDCEICHVDADRDPGSLKLMSNSRCVGCHTDLKWSQPHPVDISTNILLPDDLPLVNGRLGCITCHFFHPFSGKYQNRSGNLLRRPGRGTCSAPRLPGWTCRVWPPGAPRARIRCCRMLRRRSRPRPGSRRATIPSP